MELKQSTRLVGARDQHNYPLPVYDDGDGPLWLWGREHGPERLIRARSLDIAWEIAIDEARTIDEAEVPEAHGFDGPDGAIAMRHAVERADAGHDDYPELAEGYEYQANASGTGIVAVGHYAWLREWTRDDDVRPMIRSHDCPVVNVTFAVHRDAIRCAVDGHEEASLSSFHPISEIGTTLRALDGRYHAVDATVSWRRT